MSPGLQTKLADNLRAHGREIQLENAKAAEKMTITVDLQTDYAGLVLNVGAITLGEKNRKKMNNRKQENKNISQAVCALLNSGGGIIKGKIENENYSLIRDGLGPDLEASLCKCLPFVDWYLDFTQHGGYFYIFVKSWSVDMFVLPIGTLRTNLYTRNLEKTGGRSCVRQELPARRACPGVDESDLEDLAAAVFNKTQFQHQEDFPLARSTYVEVTLLS
ncbi:schlafen family member 12-like, partial [Sigmodon hispidus]